MVAPWTIHVSDETGRLTPVSTGGGKALFIGTYLPGDGLHEGVKRSLYHRFRGGGTLTREQLRATPMNPLLDEVAERYPNLPRDAALQRIGRRNLVRWATGEPRAFAEMMQGKIRHMWRGSGAPSDTIAGGGFHYLVLALGLVGLALLALAPPLGGAPAGAADRRHQRARRAAAGRHAPQRAGDAGAARARRRHGVGRR